MPLIRASAVVLRTHKLGEADRIIVLHNGQLVADGEPAAVIASPIVQQAYLGVADAEVGVVTPGQGRSPSRPSPSGRGSS